MPNEVDTLFQRVDRHPFSGKGPDDVIRGEGDIPLLPASVAQDIDFPPLLVDFIRDGMYNSQFLEGPEDGDGSTINDDDNKLPGWSLWEEGGATGTVKWQNDASAANGVSLLVTMTSATAGDTIGIQQTVPILGRGDFHVPWWKFTSAANETDIDHILDCDFLQIDGTTVTGSAPEYAPTTGITASADNQYRVWSRPPSDAAFFRFRVGFKMGATGSDGTGSFTIEETSLRAPAHYFASYFCTTQDVGSSNKIIYLASGSTDGTQNTGSSQFMADLGGYVLATGVRIAPARSSGAASFYGYDLGNAQPLAAPAVINGSNPQTDTTPVDWDNDFLSLDNSASFAAGARLAAWVNPVTFSPTTADAGVTVRLLLTENP